MLVLNVPNVSLSPQSFNTDCDFQPFKSSSDAIRTIATYVYLKYTLPTDALNNLIIFFSVVTFEIGDRDPRTPPTEEDNETGWECVWKCHTATPVHHMAFSPDGTLFATSGKSDRLVKVWYENKHRK